MLIYGKIIKENNNLKLYDMSQDININIDDLDLNGWNLKDNICYKIKISYLFYRETYSEPKEYHLNIKEIAEVK